MSQVQLNFGTPLLREYHERRFIFRSLSPLLSLFLLNRVRTTFIISSQLLLFLGTGKSQDLVFRQSGGLEMDGILTLFIFINNIEYKVFLPMFWISDKNLKCQKS